MTREERIAYLIAKVEELHDTPQKLCEDDIYGIIEALENQPKQGKWIYKKDEDTACAWYKCSECGKSFWEVSAYKFCPNCGAKMGDEKNEI